LPDITREIKTKCKQAEMDLIDLGPPMPAE
jgi:hypothetical protein